MRDSALHPGSRGPCRSARPAGTTRGRGGLGPGLFLGLALAFAALSALAAEPTVFAAASTKRALDAAIAESGLDAVVSYGASGSIARQIDEGAPADLFLSANPRWMTHLAETGAVAPGDIVTLMSNALVLVAREGAAPLDLSRPLSDRLGDEVFVMADPGYAPVGQYGQEALETLGLWTGVAPSLVPTRNTLATVAAVQRGEAALGLVYASDARDVPGIVVVATLPAESHAPIRYLAAPLRSGPEAEAGLKLLAFLRSDAGQRVLAQHGFQRLETGS